MAEGHTWKVYYDDYAQTFALRNLHRYGDLFVKFEEFAQDVANYRVIPAALVPLLAAAVVGIELLAGIALVTGVMERSAAAVLAVLLGAFTVLLTQALLRGIDLRCGCFGGDERASWWTVLRDLVMLATALAVARGRAPERTRVTYPA